MRGGGVYAAVLSPPLSSLTPQHDHAASRPHRMTSSSSSCTTGNGGKREPPPNLRARPVPKPCIETIPTQHICYVRDSREKQRGVRDFRGAGGTRDPEEPCHI